MSTTLSQIPRGTTLANLSALVGVTNLDKDVLIPWSLIQGLLGGRVDPLIINLTPNAQPTLSLQEFIDWTGENIAESPIGSWATYGSRVVFAQPGIYQVVAKTTLKTLSAYGATVQWGLLTEMKAGINLYGANLYGDTDAVNSLHHIDTDSSGNSTYNIWTDTFTITVDAAGGFFQPMVHWDAAGASGVVKIRPEVVLTITQLKSSV